MPTAAAIARRNIATKTAPAIISKTFSAISIINKIQIKHQNTWKTRHECSKLQKNNNTRKNICFSYYKKQFCPCIYNLSKVFNNLFSISISLDLISNNSLHFAFKRLIGSLPA